jgi:effector-binding domain-containing protein
MVLGGKFLREEFEMDWSGSPFKGEYLLGAQDGEIHATWVDSMSGSIFAFKGKLVSKNKMELTSLVPSKDFYSQKPKVSRHVLEITDDDHFVFSGYDKLVGASEEKCSMVMKYTKIPCHSSENQASSGSVSGLISEKPEMYVSKDEFYLYLEKNGPFDQSAGEAWREFHKVHSTMQLKMQPNHMQAYSIMDESKQGDDKYTYQAGLTFDKKVDNVPPELKIRPVKAGKTYASFTYKGPYDGLKQAYPAALAALPKNGLKLQKNELIMERYLNTPQDTKPEDLMTVLLFPVENQ